MARYYLPNVVIGLGGAGTELAKTMLEQDWILEEAMQSDPREEAPLDEKELDQFDVHLIDTDLDTGWTDEVEKNIDDIHEPGTRNKVQIKTELDLTNATRSDWLNEGEITNGQTVRDNFKENINSWWLTSEESLEATSIISPVSNSFTQGVKRRRGLSKALFRVAQSEAGHEINNINLGTTDRVAVIAGLGGGTGSGLITDVGFDLLEDADDKTLFGILPRPSGDDNESELQNSFAALSELEYLSLVGNNPFENIILLPYDPADSTPVFDEAVVKAIVAYYNWSEDPGNEREVFNEIQPDGPDELAPFTLATPYTIEILKENVEESEKRLIEFLENYISIQKREMEMLEELKSLVNLSQEEEKADDNESGYIPKNHGTHNIESKQAERLKEDRFDLLLDLADLGIITNLGWESADKFIEEVQSYEVDEDEDEDMQIITDLVGQNLSRADFAGDTTANENLFVDAVANEITIIQDHIEILKAGIDINNKGPDQFDKIIDIQTHPSRLIYADIQLALSENRGKVNREVNEDIIDKLDKRINKLQSETTVIENIRNDLIDRAENQAEDWTTGVENDLKVIANYAHHWEPKDDSDCYQALEDLRTFLKEVDNFLQEVEQNQGEIDEDMLDEYEVDKAQYNFEDYTEVNNPISTIEEGLDSIDYEPTTDIRAVINSVDGLLKKKEIEFKIKLDDTDSLLTKYTPLGGSSDDGDPKTTYKNIKNDAEDIVIYEDQGFSVNFSEIDRSFIEDITSRIYGSSETPNIKQERIILVKEEFAEAIETTASFPDEQTIKTHPEGSNIEDVDSFIDEIKDEYDDVKGDSSGKAQAIVEELEDHEWQPPRKRVGGFSVPEAITGTAKDYMSKYIKEQFEELVNSREDEIANLQQKRKECADLIEIIKDYSPEISERTEFSEELEDIMVSEEPEEWTYKKKLQLNDPGLITHADHLGDEDIELLDDDIEKGELSGHLGNQIDRVLQKQLVESEPEASGDVSAATYIDHVLRITMMSRLFDGFSVDFEDLEFKDVIENKMGEKEGFEAFAQKGSSDIGVAEGQFADEMSLTTTLFLGGVFMDNLSIVRKCSDIYSDGYNDYDVDWLDQDLQNVASEVHPMVARHTYGIDGVTQGIDEADFIPKQADGAFTHRTELLNPKDGEDMNDIQSEDKIENTLARHKITGFPSAVDLSTEE